MQLYQLFKRCLEKSYTHTENGGDYAFERRGNTLFIYLQWSNGHTDWKNNFDFPAKPYRRMGRTVWLAHRGFSRVWKSVEPYLSHLIDDATLDGIVTVGYSHGAALAVFCHEYAWYHRPDLRNALEGYGFGCPRVLWGFPSSAILSRWDRFLVIRNANDLVTHVPPSFLGYRHVGELLEIGKSEAYTPIDAHRPENILKELFLHGVRKGTSPSPQI